jgi:hypothetical protein
MVISEWYIHSSAVVNLGVSMMPAPILTRELLEFLSEGRFELSEGFCVEVVESTIGSIHPLLSYTSDNL